MWVIPPQKIGALYLDSGRWAETTTLRAASASNHHAEYSGTRPRVYFAAERTFLAWIRTGLGLMGVGFAVARFGLFLRQMQASQSHASIHQSGISVLSGTAIVALGVIVLIASVIQHLALIRELSTGTWTPGRSSRNAIVLATLLALVGVVMAIYLLIIR